MERIRSFLEDTRAELGKVTWPTPRQTANLTVIVFVVAGAVGAYIFVWDFVLSTSIGLIPGLGGT
ncbi:MAG TPA: preprotein translocase subunit SecE [Candidatus Limnocylindrales bacterium]|nr:preprotein translocase subunit SecE [Candidatus Limnocylindrales bacterium]